MSELPIESKKYGKFVVLYDECDEGLVKGKGYTWYIHKSRGTFYVETNVPVGNGKYKKLYMHRLLTKAPPGMMVDHNNHIGWDNRQSNLRVCSCTENNRNRLKQKAKASSQYKGVSWHKAANKWQAEIKIDGKLKYIGYYLDEIDAAKAYDNAALKHFGPYAQLNFPRPIVVVNVTINN